MTDEERREPEAEVWNHLEQTIQNVYNDINAQLHPDAAKFYEAVGKQFLSLRVGIVANPADVQTPRFLAELSPATPPSTWQKLVLSLDGNPASWDPWIRQAVELEIAKRGIGRSVEALARYLKLRTRLVSRRIPEKALPYLNEVVDCFLFGFDAPCIAFACSCFEQLAKVALLAIGELTEGRIRRERPTAYQLLAMLSQRNLLTSSKAAAEKLVERRNQILHRSFADEKILQQLSLDSIGELVDVAIELSPSWAA